MEERIKTMLPLLNEYQRRIFLASEAMAYGQTYLDRYALPFMVRVTTEKLNVRKGPGTEHDKNGSVEMGEAFTIVEVQGDWGRLKSDAGWICLRYTQRV